MYMGQRRRHDVRHRRSHRPRCRWACPSGRVSTYPGSCSCKPGKCVPFPCHATEVQSHRPRPRLRRRPYPFLPFPVFPLPPRSRRPAATPEDVTNSCTTSRPNGRCPSLSSLLETQWRSCGQFAFQANAPHAREALVTIGPAIIMLTVATGIETAVTDCVPVILLRSVVHRNHPKTLQRK